MKQWLNSICFPGHLWKDLWAFYTELIFCQWEFFHERSKYIFCSTRRKGLRFGSSPSLMRRQHPSITPSMLQNCSLNFVTISASSQSLPNLNKNLTISFDSSDVFDVFTDIRYLCLTSVTWSFISALKSLPVKFSKTSSNTMENE